jgi:Flp pilus assembly pilin Flp
MWNLINKLIADESAQDMAEYGIALAVIGTAAGAAAVVIATDVGSLWSKAQTVIDTAAGA